jgi:hypothetical protein
MHDGVDGYQVVTPLDRSAEFEGFKGNTTVLINRGWIPKDKADHRLRPDGLPRGTVVVEGLLREPWKKNMFTPDNKPEEGKFYFPDVYEMAAYTNSQPVWVEETMRPDLLESYAREDKGVPIGRPPEVNLRNNHGQVSFFVSIISETRIMLTQSLVHLHMVQLERRHDCHDVDAIEEAHQRHQSQSPPEQVVVNRCCIQRYVFSCTNRSVASDAMYTCTLDVSYISLFPRFHYRDHFLVELFWLCKVITILDQGQSKGPHTRLSFAYASHIFVYESVPGIRSLHAPQPRNELSCRRGATTEPNSSTASTDCPNPTVTTSSLAQLFYLVSMPWTVCDG